MLWSGAQTFRRLSLEKLFGDLRGWSPPTGGTYRKPDFTGASVEVRCTLHLFRFSARVGLRFKDFEFKLKAIESGFALAVEEEAMA
jgi:hypothetical protein